MDSLLEPALERSTMRRVIWRIVPFLMVCYLFSIIDRGNIGMASLQMNEDLKLSKSAFALASSLFFVSYFLAEVPSNLALQKFGARRWIARIMISWGLLSSATALVSSAKMLYVMRFLLGAAEAGFFPGVLLYLSYWLPRRYRARIVATFMASIPAANFLGAPLSGALLSLDGSLGMRGWHWVFVAEGVPTLVLGCLCFFVLTDRPSQAAWLTPEQRAWLDATLKDEQASTSLADAPSTARLLLNPFIWALALAYSGPSAASTVLSVWQPQLIKSAGGLSNFQVGLISALPFGVASGAMILWGASSDKAGERKWHACAAILLIVAGVLSTMTTTALIPTMVMLCAILVGAYSAKGPFWALCYEWLSPRTAAAGLAVVGAVSNLIGGGIAINIYGFILDKTGRYALALLPLAILNLAGFGFLLVLGRKRSR